MANYHIGLDFGTSQTKVCLLNTDNDEREFVEFDNASFFLPTIITRKKDGTFSYGKEDENGTVYRYFKMAAAEDEDLIQATNEDLKGKTLSQNELDNFRRYNENHDIKPEILSILYLSYVLLYVKDIKQEISIKGKEKTGALARFSQKKTEINNTFSIKMGIPTEWHNPHHIKRKIKFETILIVVNEFFESFSNLADFLKENSENLICKATEINKKHSTTIEALTKNEKELYIHSLLHQHKLSVFPETAAGITFLLANERLPNGYFAAMDIGAGTSDISIFKVNNHKIEKYLCSESVEMASNNIYAEYSSENGGNGSFNEIKETENLFKNKKCNSNQLNIAISEVRRKLEFIVRKTYYRKHFKPLRDLNANLADQIREALSGKYIILYGGGACFPIINEGEYMYFRNNPNPFKQDRNRFFITNLVTNYTKQLGVKNREKVEKDINLLILALGLSYLSKDVDENSFFATDNTVVEDDVNNSDANYFYYDIQDAVYK